MEMIAIQCPSCQATLHAPVDYIGKCAKCKGCGHVFLIKAGGLEDSIASWLAEGNDAVDRDESGETHDVAAIEEKQARPAAAAKKPAPSPAANPPPAVVQRPVAAAPGPAKPAPVPQKVQAAPKPAPKPVPQRAIPPQRPPRPGPVSTVRKAPTSFGAKSGLRVSHVDVLGAFFVFPSRLLEDVSFRASLPRCCLGCGVGQGLKTHLVMWTSKFQGHDPGVLTQHDIGTAIGAEVLHRLSANKLLEALPHVPNLPHPFDLPMPYFICNRCTPAGAIMTHVRPMVEEGWEQCELGIASLKRAMEFLARNLGRDHEDYALLDEALREHKADAWRALPLPVRNRIEAWYKAAPGERFLCYVRDSDFAQAEAGLGGLVMTDRRMVYRKTRIQREVWMTDKLELATGQENGQYVLKIGRVGAPRPSCAANRRPRN